MQGREIVFTAKKQVEVLNIVQIIRTQLNHTLILSMLIITQ